MNPAATLALVGTLISTAIVGGAFWFAADALGQQVTALQNELSTLCLGMANGGYQALSRDTGLEAVFVKQIDAEVDIGQVGHDQVGSVGGCALRFGTAQQRQSGKKRRGLQDGTAGQAHLWLLSKES